MRKSRAFTLIELTVVISIIALLIVILLPALGCSARRTPRKMQTSTHLRGIHQGEIFFAQGNNGWYTGFDRQGGDPTGHQFSGDQQIAAGGGTGTWGSGAWDVTAATTPAWRMRRLLENDYFPAEYAVSALEIKPLWVEGTALTPENFSYAMLQIDTDGDGNYIKTARTAEHKFTNNSEAAILADRCIRSGKGAGRTDAGIRSVHTNPSDPTIPDYKGAIVWNDNHVTFETSSVLKTRYDTYLQANDNIFLDDFAAGSDYDGDGKSDFAKPSDAEAGMVWKNDGNTNPVNQDDYVDFE